MANKDAPFGLRPVGELGSNIQNAGTTKYRIATGSTAAIYKGDLVTMASGVVAVASGTANTLIGVFNGCFYNDPTTQKPTWSNYYPDNITPTVGNIDAYVYDDPSKLFEVQSTGQITYVAAVGKNVDTTYTAGSTINGQSKVEMTATAGTGTAQLRVVGISEDPENSDAASANANWIVKINEHLYGGTDNAGVGT